MISYDLSVDEVASNDSNNLKTPPSPTNVNIDSSNSSQELKNEQSSVTNSKESSNIASDNNHNSSIKSNNSISIGSAKIIDDSENPSLANNSNITSSDIGKNETIDSNKMAEFFPKDNSLSLNEKVEKQIEENKSNSLLVPILSNDSPSTETNTAITSNLEETHNKTIAPPLSSNSEANNENEYSELGPDTPAVEDEPYINAKIMEKKAISYSGKLVLSDSIEAYKFLGDKNKCWPQSICYDKDGNLWVLDGQLNHINCYNTKGIEIVSFGSKGKAINELGLPVSLAVFKDFILVGDRQKNSIHIFDKKGNWLNAIQSDPNVGLKISNPVSICVRNNEIWVGDSRTNRVLCFDDRFSFLGSFGSTKESVIESISSIATDNEYIYILEEEGVLKKFGTMGNFISAFHTDIKYSTGLFIDSNKNIWITDIEAGKINCFSNDEGKILFSINKKNLSSLYKEGDKLAPSSISINSAAKIAIADTYSKNIKIFEIK